MAKQQRSAAIDIGTTKIACAIAETDRAGKTSVVGFGAAPPDGFKSSVVVNLDRAAASVEAAMRAAEEMAGGRTRSLPVFVGIAGEHVRYMAGEGAVSVRRPKHGIVAADVAEVMKQAQALRLPNDETILHVVPTQFIVDGQKGIRDPLGLFGVRLGVEVLLVTAAVTAVENIYKVLQRLEVKDRALGLAAIASFHGVCDDDDKDAGVLLVDLGGITDTAIYRDGEIRHTRLLPVGAANITRDIAVGLRTTIPQAEEVKRKWGCALASVLEHDEAIAVEDASGRGTKQVSRRLLASIIEPRVDEILGLVREESQKTGLLEGLAGGVVLTGGGSQLAGIEVAAEQVFGMPVRFGRPDRLAAPREFAQDPSFATAAGLIRCGLEGRCISCYPEPGFITRAMDDVKGLFG
jgi:cell division protein FtsA